MCRYKEYDVAKLLIFHLMVTMGEVIVICLTKFSTLANCRTFCKLAYSCESGMDVTLEFIQIKCINTVNM